MDKKLLDTADINKKSVHFLEYLKCKVGSQVFDFLIQLAELSEVLVFSGVIRNYFLKYKGEIRDLDLVIKCDDYSTIDRFISNFDHKRNSFGGYKLRIGTLNIDLWHIKKTWAFSNFKVALELFEDYSLPDTSFFNFSSIIFDFKKNEFIYNSNFKKFLETREIDLVLEKNPMPQLCIVNTIYYKEKFRLEVSDQLKIYCLKYFKNYTESQYHSIQIKHFNEVKYDYLYLKAYMRMFNDELSQLMINS